MAGMNKLPGRQWSLRHFLLLAQQLGHEFHAPVDRCSKDLHNILSYSHFIQSNDLGNKQTSVIILSLIPKRVNAGTYLSIYEFRPHGYGRV